MKYLVLFITLFSFNSFAEKMRVLNFNTMCDFCKGADYSDFEARAKSINALIKSYSPDILSLQELRTVGHVKMVLEGIPDIKFIATDSFFMSYADPAIAYNSKKYKEVTRGQFWLGPNPDTLNFGWKFALPRQVHWILLTTDTDKKFFVVSSHFDNRVENLLGASLLVPNRIRSLLKDKNIPLIFAADTNITPDVPEYKNLLSDQLINAFDIKENFTVNGEAKDDRSLCYLRKGKVFPTCRVDHVLLSKNTQWKVKNFIIDTKKTYKTKFPSDHRSVIVDLEF